MKRYTLALLFGLLIALQPAITRAQSGFVQKGEASYYASQFHGRPTASGERYNKNLMTASHKKLPFGTKVRVTNLANKKTIVVTINDRGPYVPRRIIDVSLAAAKELDMLRSGIAPVKIEVVGQTGGSNYTQSESGSNYDSRESYASRDDGRYRDDNSSDFVSRDDEPVRDEDPVTYNDDNYRGGNDNNSRNTRRERLPSFAEGGTFTMSGTQRYPDGYTIQVGAFGKLSNAQTKVRELNNRGFNNAYIQVVRDRGSKLHKVVVGELSSEAAARRLQEQLSDARFYGFLSKHLR